MITSYSGFTSIDDLQQLHIQVKRTSLFDKITLVQPSNLLQETVRINRQLPLGNEKAKSEMLVAPVLSEIWQRNKDFCTLFSGYTLDADKENGLTGRCDFLFSNVNTIVVEAPIITIVEAKNDNVDDAVPQCAAQMLAAKLYNEKKNASVPSIYGAATTGFEWLFMRLDGSTAFVDTEVYQLRALPELLGVLQHVVDFYKNA